MSKGRKKKQVVFLNEIFYLGFDTIDYCLLKIHTISIINTFHFCFPSFLSVSISLSLS